MLDNLFEQAITTNNIKQFQELTDSLDLVIIKAQRFPDEVFQLFLDLFSKSYFLEMENSRQIFYVLRSNFDFLSKVQQDELILALKQVYEKLQDWMSWFTISEILGECYQNEQALQTLCYLKQIKTEHPRSFVAHGLEHLVKSNNLDLSKSALMELIEMKNDPSERVQHEVNLSLGKLKNQRLCN